MDDLLTISEVAERLRLPVSTLYTWRHRGEGPPSFTLGPRAVRYRRVDVERWLADQAAAR